MTMDWKYGGIQMPRPATVAVEDPAPQFAYGVPDTKGMKDEKKEKAKEKTAAPAPATATATPQVQEKPPSPSSLIELAFHHSSFLAGAPIAAAGEIRAKDGILRVISNASGHYKPPIAYVKQVVLELRDRGYDFNKQGEKQCILEDAAHGAEKSKQTPIDGKAIMTFTKELLEKNFSRSQPAPEKELGHDYAGEAFQSQTVGVRVQYLRADELKKYELKVEGGIVKQNGKPFDTTGAVIYGRAPMRDRFIFVMTPRGEIYAADVWKAIRWKPSPWVDLYYQYYYEKRADKNREEV